jgi:hypothetical protein
MTRPGLFAVCLFALIATLSAPAQSEEPNKIDASKLRELRDRISGLETQIAELKRTLHELSRNQPGSLPPTLTVPSEEAARRIESYPQAPKTATPVPYSDPQPRYPAQSAPVVPKHWQRLEINGQAFYIIPVGEVPQVPADAERKRY